MKNNKIRYMGGIICGSSAVDQTSQSLSVFNVIDEITVDLKAKDPTQTNLNSIEPINLPINFQIISIWKRNNLSDYKKDINVKIEVEVLDPLGKSLQKTNIDAFIPAGKKRSRYILNVSGMTVTTTGEYLVQFREIDREVKSDVLASLTLEIIVNKS